MDKLVDLTEYIDSVLPYCKAIDDILAQANVTKIQGSLIFAVIIATQFDKAEDIEFFQELLSAIHSQREVLLTIKNQKGH